MKFDKNQNQYLYRVSLSINRLQKIYDQEIDYTPDDYPVLINTFERYYKGVCLKLHELYPEHPNFQANKGDYHRTHRFTHLIKKINDVIPVSNSKEDFDCILSRANWLGKRYTKARFSHEFGFDEFQSDFNLLKGQVERINEMLEAKEKQNTLNKEEDYKR